MKTEKVAAACLGMSLFAASSGITSAYLTAHPKALTNLITPGTVDVELTESAWQPEKATGLTPGSVVPKNPAATNTGESDAWIFLRVSVPVRHISVVNPQTHRKEPAADMGLFSFTVSEGWEQIACVRAEDSINYVYGYQKLMKSGERTAPLFESVTLVNYLEGELTAEEVLQIPVRAAAVQDHICAPGAGLAKIYEAYLAQEEQA